MLDGTMNWRAIAFVLIVVVLLFALMFYSGMFMPVIRLEGRFWNERKIKAPAPLGAKSLSAHRKLAR